MKKLHLFLCILFIFSLCGCTLLAKQTTASAEHPTSEACYPAKVDTADGPADWIMTDYYHLSVPSSWDTTCVYTTQEQKDGGHILNIYEKQAYFDKGTGLLWSVRLFPEGEDFTSYLNHTVYGIMEANSQSYYVVVLSPTDAQYTKKTQVQYDKMLSKRDSIMDTLEPKNSYKYFVPQLERIDPVFETDYYSLTLPAKWLDQCVIDVNKDNDCLDVLTIREKESSKTEYGGHLFTIRLVPSDEGYDKFLSYELLAVLDTPEGSFYAVALFSDVVPQYCEEAAAVYEELVKDIPDVLSSLSPREGVEMCMPAPAIE